VAGLLMARKAWFAPECAEPPACDPCEFNGQGRAPLWTWSAFGATLALLFAAELGDKTQLAVLGLAGESRTPLPVFLGATMALTVTSGLGVLGGEGLSRLLPPCTLQRISAGMFVMMGVLMLLGVL